MKKMTKMGRMRNEKVTNNDKYRQFWIMMDNNGQMKYDGLIILLHLRSLDLFKVCLKKDSTQVVRIISHPL